MRAAILFAQFLVLGVLCSCTAPSYWTQNPALAAPTADPQTHVYLEEGALIWHQSQNYFQMNGELDQIREQVLGQLYSMGLQSLPADLRTSPISRPWGQNLWFRAQWPLYAPVDQAPQSILIHRMDFGIHLQAPLLYSANSSSTEEGEIDTLVPQKIAVPELELWTCLSYWNNQKAQYLAYGCFPFVFRAKSGAWDREIVQSKQWEQWLKLIRSGAPK